MKHSIILLIALSAFTACSDGNASKPENDQPKDNVNMNKTTTVADYATDPNIESQTKEFLKALNGGGGKPLETLPPADARKVLEGAQTSVKVEDGDVEIGERTIQQDGLSVKLYTIRPTGQAGVLPVFLFFHGGGWVLGDFPTHKRLVRDLVLHSGATCVFVEYSRSPEVRYPVALNECYAATKWVAEHAAELKVDGKRMAVAGNSAGGNLAAAVALMAKDRKGPALKFQLLLWPVTDADFETVSYNEYATDRFLTKNMMIWFWDSYINKEQRREIYAAPLQATTEQLAGLPPALVQTAENDVLRDEGEAYARKMNAAGVGVALVRMQGMIHDYGLLNPLAPLTGVQSALRYAASELKFVLSQP
ncbi:alpha/beta hydrolase [Flavihumibacter petaseus]|uniref:Putative esterase n=1 Tax=Flavihumibacter petaseus NBRC 106054 TaxID=1220578 RepID=A0A0E9N4E6_9BACT|nr:alpha/beta hydrolase [Flavihumibacter petaseus]GAO44699.1 putative esterase [Flavihumibacter petaseus NBRC 106054]